MSQWQGNPEPAQPQHTAPPKKRHTVRNILIVVGSLFALVIVTAVLSGGQQPASAPVSKAPVSVTSKAVVPTSIPVETPTSEPTKVATTTAPAPKPTATQPAMTAGQEQAVGSAESYLSFKAFSRKGLIQQLSSEYGEGFSKADATYAVDHITVDWNEQAAKSAEAYLEMKHFSRSGLIQQLESSYGEGFTHRQAVYGVTKAGL